MDISRLEKGCSEGESSHPPNSQWQNQEHVTSKENNTADVPDVQLATNTREMQSKIDRLLKGLLKAVEDFGVADEAAEMKDQGEAAAAGSTDPSSRWRAPFSVRNPPDLPRQSPFAIAAAQNARIMSSLPIVDHTTHHQSEQRMPVEECLINVKSCRDRWNSRRHGPHVKIRVMNDLVIQVSESTRRNVREEWKSGCSSDRLLDCWKHIWRHEGSAPTGLSRWACDDAKRQKLQLDLIDAIVSGRPAPFFLWIMDKDFRAIACWISLIGIRLNDLYRFTKPSDVQTLPHSLQPISPVAQVEVLIEYLWASNGPDDPVLGKVLENCYRRGVLMQPPFDDPPDFISSKTELKGHVYAVRVAVYLVNLLFKHNIPRIRPHEDLDSIWLTPVHEIEKDMRQTIATSQRVGGGNPFFSVSDLNFRDLRGIGHLRLIWTPYWDEHLKLDNNDDSYVLYLYWFHHDLSSYFSSIGLCGGLAESDRRARTQEMVRTMRLLFASESGIKEVKRDYGNIGSPKWLSLLAASDFDVWNRDQEIEDPPCNPPELSRFMLNRGDGSTEFCTETRFHLSFHRPECKERTHRKMSYSNFPYYGQRLMDLRTHMDSQQSRGLRGLWEDNRNSLAYYTFWFVIFFSSLTILLGVGALATSIAQTWASFQSLHKSGPKQ
ncbi:MAG: hypothetical protein Q9216_003949 [Gyalolechia sp. 2 TL-2023]